MQKQIIDILLLISNTLTNKEIINRMDGQTNAFDISDN